MAMSVKKRSLLEAFDFGEAIQPSELQSSKRKKIAPHSSSIAESTKYNHQCKATAQQLKKSQSIVDAVICQATAFIETKQFLRSSYRLYRPIEAEVSSHHCIGSSFISFENVNAEQIRRFPNMIVPDQMFGGFEYLCEVYGELYSIGLYDHHVNYSYHSTMQLIAQQLTTQIPEIGIVTIILECLRIAHICSRCANAYWSMGICICETMFQPTLEAKYMLPKCDLEVWIKYVVKLPQYYGLLVDNGYETLVSAQNLTTYDLKAICIVNVNHIEQIAVAADNLLKLTDTSSITF